MDSHKILIIDDSEFIVRAVSSVLAKEGYVTVTSTSAVGIVGLILREQPSLVLVDVTMPAMRGYALSRLIANVAATTSIVFYSTLPEELLAQVAADSGAHGYVCKSSSPHHLLFRLRQLLAHHTAGQRSSVHSAPEPMQAAPGSALEQVS